MKYGKSLIAAALSAATLMSTQAMAADHVVTASVTAFDPMVVVAAPGDTVSWTNMNGHIANTKFVTADGEVEFIPEGATGWTSAMGENFTTSPLTVEGIYLYKCDPHWGAGMGGAIVVGNANNLDAIKATNPKGALKRLVKKAEKAIK
jgi:pseudoazurin